MTPIFLRAVIALALAAPACVFVPGLMGAYSAQKHVVVPASEAPPPPPGTGWNCFDYYVETFETDRTNPTSYVTQRNKCLRTSEACREKAYAVRISSPPNTKVEVGSCGPQPEAYCSYLFHEKKFDCWRDLASCTTTIGGPTGLSKEDDLRQTECALLR